MPRVPAFSEALLRAKKAFNAQAGREGRPSLSEHAFEDAVWAVYELLVPRSQLPGLRKLDDGDRGQACAD